MKTPANQRQKYFWELANGRRMYICEQCNDFKNYFEKSVDKHIWVCYSHILAFARSTTEYAILKSAPFSQTRGFWISEPLHSFTEANRGATRSFAVAVYRLFFIADSQLNDRPSSYLPGEVRQEMSVPRERNTTQRQARLPVRTLLWVERQKQRPISEKRRFWQ